MRGACLIVAASLLPGAQELQIGAIELFGLRKIPEERIRSVLGVREGDSIVPSDSWGKSVRRRIEAIAGVSRVDVSLGCCDHAGKGTLTIGIVEEGAPAMAFRAAPTLRVRLPKKIVGTYHRCMDAWEHAVRIGDNQDNVEEGHSLMANSEVRAV